MAKATTIRINGEPGFIIPWSDLTDHVDGGRLVTAAKVYADYALVDTIDTGVDGVSIAHALVDRLQRNGYDAEVL